MLTLYLSLLAGSGKTETALHFVRRNISKYKTGVMFLNAASKQTIEADFVRLHGILGLPQSSDLILSVRHWLANAENSSWIMVLDNANDLPSIDLANYIPGPPCGHIVFVTQDQDAIGAFAKDGCDIGVLTIEHATELLFDFANLQNVSDEETAAGREIAHLLGCLPLALVQAGAFMRSRHKSPRQYRALFEQARYELLKFQPRLPNFQRTVLSVWELTFRQLEEEPNNAYNVLLLFSCLEPSSITEELLHRGTAAQKRWNQQGEVHEVLAQDEDVDDLVIQLVQDEVDFDISIEKLRSSSLVSCMKNADGLRLFTIHPLVQYCVTSRIPESELITWRLRATLLICHAFPRDRYLETL